jgi:hypothetical protein
MHDYNQRFVGFYGIFLLRSNQSIFNRQSGDLLGGTLIELQLILVLFGL